MGKTKTSQDQRISNAVKHLRDKKNQAAETAKWLHENYCACHEVCLPRNIVYEHYLDFCRSHSVRPICKATFGKLVRGAFPEVTSKRLGARGHSKYHYNGIGIKPSSGCYATAPPPSSGLTRFSTSDLKPEVIGNQKRYSLATRVGTLLPRFPSIDDFKLPPSLDPEKLAVFLTMYRTHCQCIVDTATAGNFEEIRVFLLHFWQGFPDHLMFLVHVDLVVDLITLCDWILHKTLLDILFPSTLCEIPESLLCSAHNLGRHWPQWLRSSLENLPQKLRQAKTSAADVFTKAVRRYVAFLHLAQVVRPLLQGDVASLCDEMDQFDSKWMDLESFAHDDNSDVGNGYLFLNDFQEQLRRAPTVESLTDWLDRVARVNIFQNADSDTLMPKARLFLLQWIFAFNRLSFFFTSTRSKHFSLLHLLCTLLQEYLFLAVEDQLSTREQERIHSNLKRHLKHSDRCSSADLFNSPSSCFLIKYENSNNMKAKRNNSSDNCIDLQKEGISEKFKRYRTLVTERVCDSTDSATSARSNRNFATVNCSGASQNYLQIADQYDGYLNGQRSYYHDTNPSAAIGTECVQAVQFTSHYSFNSHRNEPQMIYSELYENPLLTNYGPPTMEQPVTDNACHQTNQETCANHTAFTNAQLLYEQFFLPTDSLQPVL